MDISQKTFVRNCLLDRGFISRNYCLRRYISRLSAIIFDLKLEGMEFITERVEIKTQQGISNDFIYHLVKK